MNLEPEPTVEEKKCVGFHEMDLDERIQKSIAKLGWMKPTLIQVFIHSLALPLRK